MSKTEKRGCLGTDESASTTIEYALIAPIILVVALELLAFGIHLGAETVARRIASDAAVYAAQTGESPVERIEIAQGFLDENRGRYNLVDTDRIDISARHHPEDQDTLIVDVAYDTKILPVPEVSPILSTKRNVVSESIAVADGGVRP